MKWFKHMADAADDPFIEWLEETYGFEGVGRWWRILETIARSMEKNKLDPSAEHTWSKWQSILRGNRSKLLDLLTNIERRGKMNLKQNENVLEITIPNILKLRDEYSRKSGHTPDKCPDNVAPDTETEKREERDKEKKHKKEKAESPQFETFWKHYPRKVDKGHARKAFEMALKKSSFDEIMPGVVQYASGCAGREERYIAHAQTWLNGERWKDEQSSTIQGVLPMPSPAGG